MAKKRGKSGNLFPKKIGGVRVPKAVRKGRFGELLASPTGQALIAEAVVGAGAIAADLKVKDNPKVRKTARDGKEKVSAAGSEAAGNAGAITSTLAYALGEAARSFAEAIRKHGGEPRSFAVETGESAWTPDYGAPEPPEGGSVRRQQSPPLEA